MRIGMVLALSLLSFLATLIVLPSWIRRANEKGFVGRDVHKRSESMASGAHAKFLVYILQCPGAISSIIDSFFKE